MSLSFPSRRSLFFAAAALAAACAGERSPDAQPLPKKALLIGVSNVNYDELQKLIAQKSATGFAKLSIAPAFTGGVVETIQEQPTLLGPTWASILTGTWTDRHQVVSDDVPTLQIPSVFSTIKKASASNHIAASASQNAPLSYLLQTESAAGNLDQLSLCETDDCVATATLQSISAGTSQLVVAQLTGLAPDFDNSIAQYEDAILATDQYLGQILSAIAARTSEQWLVVVTTDNGLVNDPADGLQTLPNKLVFVGMNQPGNALFSMSSALSQTPTAQVLNTYPSVADIAPTLLSWLGISPGAAGTSWLEGSPLLGNVGVRQVSAPAALQTSGTTLAWVLPQASSGAIDVYRNGTHLAALASTATQYTDTTSGSLPAGSLVSYDLVQNGVSISYLVKNATVNLASTLTQGLVHFYALDTNLNDSVGNDELVHAVNAPNAVYAGVTGPVSDAALSIDPSKGGFRMVDDLTSGTAANSFSTGLWIRNNGYSTLPILLNKDWWSTPATAGVSLYIYGGLVNLQILDSTGDVRSTTLPFTSNAWVYVAATVDTTAKTATLYVGAQGQALQSVALSLAASGSSAAIDLSKIHGTGYFALGDSPGTGKYYTSSNIPMITLEDYDDLAFWNRVLTAGEVSSLQGSGKSLSTLVGQ